RQLIAMAQTPLHGSSIAVTDEATSSVNFVTALKILKTITYLIGEEFTGSLSITAVRYTVQTIIDFHSRVALDHGRIVEFDTPASYTDEAPFFT
ncbi:hypothetical protein C8R45DRAFT_850551, partial [Mycena sanguinolenta]